MLGRCVCLRSGLAASNRVGDGGGSPSRSGPTACVRLARGRGDHAWAVAGWNGRFIATKALSRKHFLSGQEFLVVRRLPGWNSQPRFPEATRLSAAGVPGLSPIRLADPGSRGLPPPPNPRADHPRALTRTGDRLHRQPARARYPTARCWPPSVGGLPLAPPPSPAIVGVDPPRRLTSPRSGRSSRPRPPPASRSIRGWAVGCWLVSLNALQPRER